MSQQSANNLMSWITASTARLPIRNTVLAQIEAALLADKLSVTEVTPRPRESTPTTRRFPGPNLGKAPLIDVASPQAGQ